MLLYFVVAVTTTQSIYINLQISFTMQYNAFTQFVLERKNCDLLLIRKNGHVLKMNKVRKKVIVSNIKFVLSTFCAKIYRLP